MTDYSKLIEAPGMPRERVLQTFSESWNRSQVLTINHKLPFTPIVWGYVSRTADFAVKIPLACNYFWGTAAQQSLFIIYGVDASTIQLTDIAGLGGNSETIYYRLSCTAPEDFKGDFSPNAVNGNPLQDSSEHNFAKLVGYGTTVIPASSTSVTIPHIYGAIPYVQFDILDAQAGRWTPSYRDTPVIDQDMTVFAGAECEPASQSVVFRSISSSDVRIRYRIWGS